MSKPKTSPLWLDEAIAVHVRTGQPLEKCAGDLDPPQHISTVDVDNLCRRRDVQKMLRAHRVAFYREMVAEGLPGKDEAVAKLWLLATELSERGDADKAANVIGQIAKLMQWINPDTVVQSWVPNPQELEEIKRRVARQLAEKPPPVN